jgi:hypothetical protein
MSSGETVRQYNGHHKGLDSFSFQYFHQSQSYLRKLLFVVHCTMVLAEFFILPDSCNLREYHKVDPT